MKRWSIKKIIKEILVVVVIVGSVSIVMSYLRAPEGAPTALPSFEAYKSIEGTPLKLDPNKETIVYIWATWCKMCQFQSPVIEEMRHSYNVVSIAVGSGNDAKLQKYMKEKEFGFNVINDTQRTLSKMFHIEAYPTLFIYDKTGALRFSEVGYTTTVGLKSRILLAQ
jgi:thiol-disulfide isomerase/thioredoxin